MGAAAGVPLATIGYTVEVAGRGKPLTGVFEGALMGAAGALSVMTVAPVGVAMDAFNIFVGIPSTILLNPWKEYKYDRSPVKMVPVEQPAPTP